jgi:hypothetical protein
LAASDVRCFVIVQPIVWYYRRRVAPWMPAVVGRETLSSAPDRVFHLNLSAVLKPADGASDRLACVFQHPLQILLIFLSNNLSSSSAELALVVSVVVTAAGRPRSPARSIEGRLVQGGPGLPSSSGQEGEATASELPGEPAPRCARTRLGANNDATINALIAHNDFIGISRFPNIAARDLSSAEYVLPASET